MNVKLPKLTFWRAVFIVILATGLYATYLRFFHGLGASTHLSDEFPWGVWIGFDVLCGVMLAAGGFTLMASVHLFHAKRFEPIARPALLTAFLGYLLVVFALMYDLGRPWVIWHPLIMWNPRSVMFEVGWCVMLYTTVLALEFAPVVFERFRLEKPMRIIRTISMPLVILGVILSTLHQSSLGSLYLIFPDKLHPLWYTPLLPVQFFISALAVGLAMTIFESNMSARHFGHEIKLPILQALGRVLVVVLALYTLLRFQDLSRRGALAYVFDGSHESMLFLGEVLLAMVLPLALLAIPRVRMSRNGLYIISISTVFGFVVNRLNVAITGMERSAGITYIPKWTEISITLMIVAIGVAAFALAVRYLPIFEHPVATAPGKEAEGVVQPASAPAH
jgi:Ni/Fe-hydrogenase subunit HybB-like protein